MPVDERTFAAEAAGWVTEVLDSRPDLPFSHALVEDHVGSTARRHDFRLYRRHTGQPVLASEIKMPDAAQGNHPLNADLVEDALDKAFRAGVQYCFTWDVRQFVLFDSHIQGVPPRSSVLWRYMGLEKFIHMLQASGLFFSYPGKLDDHSEGSLPAPTIERLRFLNAAELIENSTKKGHVVSCWHELDYESEAMWRLHAGRGAGIAIKTDFESLMESLTPGWIDDPHDAFMAGRVSYVDYDTED